MRSKIKVQINEVHSRHRHDGVVGKYSYNIA